MSIKTANNKEFEEFLKKLSREYLLYAPVLNEKDDKVVFEPINEDNISKITLGCQADVPLKECILPYNEKLSIEENPDKKIVILGARACDIEAVRVIDDVFLDEPVDPYYQDRRDKTIIIGYSCAKMEPTCFCDTVGIDPVEHDSAQAYLYKEGEKYFLKVMDEELESLFTSLPGGNEEELAELIDNRRNGMADSNFEIDLPVPVPEAAAFAASCWEKIAEKCLGCGVCTYYCPTCYCFGFFWQDKDGEDKWRAWDSCMFSLYTKHASGHNPRNSKDKRYRQRVMHKFSYHPENYGKLACVGCGRCIKRCPVHLDIRSALKLVENELKEEGGK